MRMSLAQKAAKVEMALVTWFASSLVGTRIIAVVLCVDFVLERRLRMECRMGRT